MQYTRLGKSDLLVSRICMGCMGFGDPSTGQHSWTLDETASRDIIRYGLEKGINFYDTAIAYQNGSSERYVGRALREMAKRDDIVLATKFLPRTPAQIAGGISGKEAIAQSLDQSLKNLGMDYIDLYIYHIWDYNTPIIDVLEALHTAVTAGKVRAVGISNCYAWQLAKANALAEREGLTPFGNVSKKIIVKKTFMLLICMLISSPVFATKPDAPNKSEMNIFELGIRPDRDNDFADVARQTISASVDHEAGTLAMYALQRSDNSGQAFMFELYENERAYRKHLNAAPYKAFAARAPDIIDRKKKITLEPQFLGDKHIIPNERTINNLVIVEVKPEFQSEFRNIVLPEMVESLKVEKGVLAMYAGTDSETPKRWYFYEIYASEEDYQLHRQTLHFLDYLRQTAHMSARKDAIPVKPVFLRNKGGIKQEPQR
ncbi:hypothetical protein D9C93_15120 [Escherichia coli]|nr:hypothetical protein [Escherichia coli]